MHRRRVTMGTWRILSVRGGGHEDTQYQLASGIAARAHLRVRGGHRGVHALRHPHANPEHGGLARRGGAHLRARDGRRVGVHGQLPAHHQQHNDGRLRVQGAALRHRRQERRRHLLGGHSNGKWRTPFSAFHLSHAGTAGGDYTEGNAWQYTWHVQQDMAGLTELMGGTDKMIMKLDSLFVIEQSTDQTGFVGDVTGLIGQYAHGNEPSHHVIYMYTLLGKNDRTAE